MWVRVPPRPFISIPRCQHRNYIVPLRPWWVCCDTEINHMRWIRRFFTVIAALTLSAWLFSLVFVTAFETPVSSYQSILTGSLENGRVMITVRDDQILGPAIPDLRIQTTRSARKEYFLRFGDLSGYPGDGPQFRFGSSLGVASMRITIIIFPLWLPTLLFGLWPGIALTRHIKRRYFTHGICRKCGYDLRGSPSGACPECGRESRAAAN